MYRYPSLKEASAQAKLISASHNIKLSFAKEIVAFGAYCRDWAELKSKAMGDAPEELLIVSPFFRRDDPTIFQRFKSLVELHSSDIQLYANSVPDIPGSMLNRVLGGQPHLIDLETMESVLSEVEQSDSAEHLIGSLVFYDETMGKVLNKPGFDVRKSYRIHLHSSLYGTKCYLYFRVDNGEALVELREWDCLVHRPSKTQAEDALFELSEDYTVTSRKWFNGYMIGFLGLIVGQLRAAGYLKGSIIIQKVMDVSFHEFGTNNKSRIRDRHSDDLFHALLDLDGADYEKEELRDGYVNYFIKIPFSDSNAFLSNRGL